MAVDTKHFLSGVFCSAGNGERVRNFFCVAVRRWASVSASGKALSGYLFLNGHHDERNGDDAVGSALCSSNCMACFRLSMWEDCAETSARRCSTSCFRAFTTCSFCCSAPVTWCSVTCSPEQPSNAPNTRKSSDVSTNFVFFSPVQVDNRPVQIDLYSVVLLFPVNLDASLIDTFAIFTPIATRLKPSVYRTCPDRKCFVITVYTQPPKQNTLVRASPRPPKTCGTQLSGRKKSPHCGESGIYEQKSRRDDCLNGHIPSVIIASYVQDERNANSSGRQSLLRRTRGVWGYTGLLV